MPSHTENAYRPRLRQLGASRHNQQGDEVVVFSDREGLADGVAIHAAFAPLLALMDGTLTPAEISAEFSAAGGMECPPETIERMVEKLDELLLLDSPRFRALRDKATKSWQQSRVRPAALAGSAYPAEPDALKSRLDELYRRAGLLENEVSKSAANSVPQVRGCIVPHIDFNRGGAVEALAYTPLLNEKFDVLVILGIAHKGVRYPYCLADKDFETPLGTALCDREFCAALVERLGDKLIRENRVHQNEHSIEFVTTFLQHNTNMKHARILPIVCGGLFEELRSGRSPALNHEVAQFCTALRTVTHEFEARGQRVGFIVSVDGAHIGTQFGDDTPITKDLLAIVETADREFWSHVEAGDAEEMHRHLARDNNARNVDAHPAVYALLHAFPEMRAELHHYAQAYSPEPNIMVSFAALTLLSP